MRFLAIGIPFFLSAMLLDVSVKISYQHIRPQHPKCRLCRNTAYAPVRDAIGAGAPDSPIYMKFLAGAMTGAIGSVAG